MIDSNEISRLATLPVEGVAERLGLSVNRHKSLCPFHNDSHPSLTFSTSRNRYRCFVCNAHGGTIDLVMHMLNKRFGEACQWLADNNNIILTRQVPAVKPKRPAPPPDIEWLSLLLSPATLNDEARRFLFVSRHIDPRVVQWTGISSISSPQPCWRYGRPFYDAPSLLIPYRNVDGSLLSVQSRYLGQPDEEHPRFRFPRGSRCTIFNLPVITRLSRGEPLYVAEGVTDCLALLSAGHKAIAIPSATMLTNADRLLLAALIARLATPLHMYPDNDAPGERLFSQLNAMLGKSAPIVRHALPEGCKDFGEAWAKGRVQRNVEM